MRSNAHEANLARRSSRTQRPSLPASLKKTADSSSASSSAFEPALLRRAQVAQVGDGGRSSHAARAERHEHPAVDGNVRARRVARSAPRRRQTSHRAAFVSNTISTQPATSGLVWGPLFRHGSNFPKVAFAQHDRPPQAGWEAARRETGRAGIVRVHRLVGFLPHQILLGRGRGGVADACEAAEVGAYGKLVFFVPPLLP